MRILTLAVMVLLSGCSLFGDRFRDRSLDYLNADEQPVTQTPEGVALTTVDRYVIPPLSVIPAKPTAFVTPSPEPLLDDAAETTASLNDFRQELLNPRFELDGAGTQILRLDGGFANAWSKVTDALAASSLKLTDLNRSTGTYYLEMTRDVAREHRSWWSRLWGTGETVTEQYLLKMNRARLGVYLSLLTDNDTLADTALTETVLREVKAQLEK